MKKFSCLVALLISAVVGMAAAGYSAQVCQSTDNWCYESGATGSIVADGRLDATGNLFLQGNATLGTSGTSGSSSGGVGNLTYGGTTVFVPLSQITVATNVPVGITATNMVIKSTGGVVTFLQVGRAPVDGPAISTATASAGQYLILHSTTSVDTVVITTGTATGVLSPLDATITISAAKAAVAFIYDATLAAWIAIGKNN